MKAIQLTCLGLALFTGAIAASATDLTYNYGGTLPYNYGGAGLGEFSDTTFTGTITFDPAGLTPFPYWGGDGVNNVDITIDFSNGLHGSVSASVYEVPNWYNLGNLYTTTQGLFIINGQILGSEGSFTTELYDSHGNASGYTWSGWDFVAPENPANALNGHFGFTNVGVGMDLNDAGLAGTQGYVGAAPDRAWTLGLLGFGLLLLGGCRRWARA